MHSHPVRRIARVVLVMLALSGCVAIPHDQGQLPQLEIAQTQLAADIKLANDGWPQARWWTSYGDSQLDALISKALTNSPTLEAASARINAAEAVLIINQAAQDIDVGANAGVNGQRYSANGLLPPPIGGSFVTEETLKLQARYEFDWWGKHKSQIAAAAGEANVRRAEYKQAELSLSVVIAQYYFNLQNAWAHLANLEQMAATQRALVADKVKRIAHGLGAMDEQTKAESRLSDLKVQIAKLTAQTVQEREALRALTGSAGDTLAELHPMPITGVAHTMPSQLGMELLARRPDLQAARWRVEAALSRIDVAQAAFYPELNLVGSLGLDSISLGNLLALGSRTALAGASVSVPLFDSKRLSGGLDIARSQRNELIADYNQSVLNSVRDVAQAGANLQGIENQIRQHADAVQAANALQLSAQRKFRQGLAAQATTLDAELLVLQTADVQLQLQNQQLLAEISLVKALGGGYRVDPDATTNAIVPISK